MGTLVASIESVTAHIKTGTAAWADRSLVESGFYPDDVRSPEAKLRYYASQFPIVENDSTYWAFPDADRIATWANRAPDGFTMSIKAHALLTQHYASARGLPRDVRDGLSRELRAKPHLYPKDLGPEVMRELTRRFRDALAPLEDAGKLGVVLFQFPVWFPISAANKAELERIRDAFADLRVAIELRNETWMSEDNRNETLELLADNDLIYVCVDEPQGFVASIPPVVAATSETAVIRMHGRNPARWRDRSHGRRSPGWPYLYSHDELAEWASRIRALASRTDEVHVIFSNAPLPNAVRNAQELADMLAHPAIEPTEHHAR
ncbi:MAG: DUF72 domain-containing protein [Kofleriaceae bacterium]|nr:DUF72 domain-containing protein [Kofleriaceae bacterium]